MIPKPFRSAFGLPAFNYASKGLLLFLLLGFGFKSHSQSYFYFENQLSLTKDSSITYYTFLILQNNGTGVARVRYIEPLSGEKKLVEINLLDSADISGGINNPNHYLITEGQPLPMLGAGIAGFRLPRILFKKQGEGENASYKPDAIMYQSPGKGWAPSQMLVNQQKRAKDLPLEKDLVKIFYSETDDVFKFMMGEGIELSARGVLPRRKEKLYLISVANTQDAYIGTTTQVDMANIVNTFTKLAEDMNMEIQVQKIMGSDLSVKAVETALSNLRPSPIDIVIFYYSGHGFRYSDDKSLYPRISLRLDEVADLGKNNISVESIYKVLLKKKAKVTLCISDCCNKDAGTLAPVGSGVIIEKDPGDYKPQVNAYLVKQLFFSEKPVAIVVGSADKFQLAIGDPKLGGYFTHTFTSQLHQVLYGFGRNATWLGLLATSRKQASWLSLSAPCDDDGPCIRNRRLQTARFELTP